MAGLVELLLPIVGLLLTFVPLIRAEILQITATKITIGDCQVSYEILQCGMAGFDLAKYRIPAVKQLLVTGLAWMPAVADLLGAMPALEVCIYF